MKGGKGGVTKKDHSDICSKEVAQMLTLRASPGHFFPFTYYWPQFDSMITICKIRVK